MPRPSRRPAPRLPRLTAAAGAFCLLAGTSGCSGPEKVDVEGFAPGACRDAAPTVQDIDETLIGADEKDLSPREAADQLKTAQDELLAVRDSTETPAEPPLAQAITDLVTALGFFRISVDSNNDDGTLVADARAPFDALVTRCTA